MLGSGCDWIIGRGGSPRGYECNYQNGVISQNGQTRQMTPAEQAELLQQSRLISTEVDQTLQQMFSSYSQLPVDGQTGAGSALNSFPFIGVGQGRLETLDTEYPDSTAGDTEETGPPLNLITPAPTPSGRAHLGDY